MDCFFRKMEEEPICELHNKSTFSVERVDCVFVLNEFHMRHQTDFQIWQHRISAFNEKAIKYQHDPELLKRHYVAVEKIIGFPGLHRSVCAAAIGHLKRSIPLTTPPEDKDKLESINHERTNGTYQGEDWPKMTKCIVKFDKLITKFDNWALGGGIPNPWFLILFCIFVWIWFGIGLIILVSILNWLFPLY